MMELTAGSLVWRIAIVIVAVLVFVLSRRPTLAQRITETIGAVAIAGVLLALISLDLQVLVGYVLAAALAFGFLSSAEARA